MAKSHENFPAFLSTQSLATQQQWWRISQKNTARQALKVINRGYFQPIRSASSHWPLMFWIRLLFFLSYSTPKSDDLYLSSLSLRTLSTRCRFCFCTAVSDFCRSFLSSTIPPSAMCQLVRFVATTPLKSYILFLLYLIRSARRWKFTHENSTVRSDDDKMRF